MTFLAIQDFIVVCILCGICLCMVQLIIVERNLREEKRDYEVLYFYLQTGEITHGKTYQGKNQCVENTKTNKRLCKEGKRIFYA